MILYLFSRRVRLRMLCPDRILEILPDLPVLALDERVREDPVYQAVSHMFPVSLPLQDLAEDCGLWVFVLPEIIITDHTCHFLRTGVTGAKIGRTDPAGTDE